MPCSTSVSKRCARPQTAWPRTAWPAKGTARNCASSQPGHRHSGRIRNPTPFIPAPTGARATPSAIMVCIPAPDTRQFVLRLTPRPGTPRPGAPQRATATTPLHSCDFSKARASGTPSTCRAARYAGHTMQTPRSLRIDTGTAELSLLEWPGEGDPILLLHATGFHAHCWREVARRLPGRRVLAPDLRFHGQSSIAGTPDWAVIADDIYRLVEKLDLRRAVAAGHSLGGYALARAAARDPARFQHLVLIDPVIMAPERYRQLAREHTNLGPADHPVSRRKNLWRGPEQMFARFRERPPFNLWEEQVLRDYCEHALGPANADGERCLACHPLHEAAIYLSQRGNEVVLDELQSIAPPVTLLRAAPNPHNPLDLTRSPTWPGLAGALPECREVYLPEHSHFIPMQDPALVANTLLGAP